MKHIAHRGVAAEYPENTLLAVRQATTQADMIELDLRRCGSGEIVVIHDGIVDTISERRGRVKDFSVTDLSRLNVLTSGEGVPTLTSVLDAVPPEISFNLELKETGLVGDVLKNDP